MTKFHTLYFSLMYFLIGMIHTFVGAFNQFLKINLNMNQSGVSNLISIQFIKFMFGVFYSTFLANKDIKKFFKIIHLAILVITTIFIIFEHYLIIYLVVAVLGFCAGFIESSIASYIFNINFDSAKIFGYIESFFAVGSFLLPMIVRMFEYHLDTKYAIIFIFIINVFLFLIVNSLVFKASSSDIIKIPKFSFNKKFMLVLIILTWCFFYISIETNFSNLLPYINLVSDKFSYMTVSVFWIGIIVGRFLYTLILPMIKFRIETLLLMYTVISFFLYIMLIYLNTQDEIRLIILFLLTIFLAPMFPLGASIINQHSSNKRVLTSIFIAVAGCGGVIGAVIIKVALYIHLPVYLSILFILMVCLILNTVILRTKL
ncbi:MFS transporter [Staphylococcus intermedius]|uniref:MFS transporter n=1 Tax=Staphylococcus intermedius TaxID=1285 RepID=UPI000BBC31DC|nr:MFS transporter [Staphylococcus intermedius]PCF62457.1 MFS transporter [Staphylococcus intermedius]PCF77650.1 MFS transporter [Staphylococcus intermedius]PCF77776.1 MFS transporter [Staphylococcus intermedius]